MRTQLASTLALASVAAVALVLVPCACSGGDSPASTQGTETTPTIDTDEANGEDTEAENSSRPARDRDRGSDSSIKVESRPGPQDAAEGAPGRIVGAALFDGEPPAVIRLQGPDSNPACHHDEEPLKETIVTADGKLQNVFVYIKKLENWEPSEVSKTPVLMTQKGCVYRPHVVGVRAGQTLQVSNDDPTSHNVHFYAKKNEEDNKTQAAGGKPFEFVFTKEEVAITTVCDIHPWMKAFICVVDHPFFAVTAADGSFAIEGVPPGKYRLVAWHEKLKKKTTGELTVSPGGETEVTYTFKP
jgi:plastocyanin